MTKYIATEDTTYNNRLCLKGTIVEGDCSKYTTFKKVGDDDATSSTPPAVQTELEKLRVEAAALGIDGAATMNTQTLKKKIKEVQDAAQNLSAPEVGEKTSEPTE